MSFQATPTKFLITKVVSGTSVPETYVLDEASPFYGYPTSFSVQLNIESQYHSDPGTREPYNYNALDVKVGDWLGQPSGKAYKIAALTLVDSATLNVTLEDVDTYIMRSDATASGNNYPDEEQQGVIFEIDEEGNPILANISQLSAQLPNIGYWVNDIQSRFDAYYRDEEGVDTNVDQDLTPIVTSGNGASTGISITYTPWNDSKVMVKINGIGSNLGDGVKTKDCYFSNDNGATARAMADIEAGDTLYWNGEVAGYDLDAGDEVDLDYEASTLDV